MLRVALFCVFFIVTFQAGAQTPAPENLLQKGLSAYQNKQFDQARDLFSELLKTYPQDSHVMHNLALTYAQLDQKPLALALWRKALSIDPSFRPAQLGQDFLQKRMNIRPLERDTLSLWTRQNLESISLFELSWFLAFVIGGCGFFWIRYFSERLVAIEDETPMPNFPGPAVLLTAVLLGAMVLTTLKVNLSLAKRGTVISAKASARSLPSEDGVPVFEINGGSELLIRRKDGDWLQVQNGDGTSGWLKNSELMITSGT